MKNTVKILILAISFAGVSTLILIFLNTILKPPTKVKYTNQFLPQIESLTQGLDGKSETTLNKLNDKYFTFAELIKMYEENSLLDGSEMSLVTTEFVSAYDPVYAGECLAYFSHMRWDEGILDDMTARLEQLKELSPDVYNNNQKLNTVSQVLKDYRDAMKLTTKKWKNLEESTENRALTKKYETEPYLHNNKYLCNLMEEALQRQGEQHYKHLKSLVRTLDCYMDDGTNITEYNHISSEVRKELDEYEENANKVYGEIEDVAPLRKDVSDYKQMAIIWFNRDERQDIDY